MSSGLETRCSLAVMYGREANKDFPKELNEGIEASKEKSERETKTAKMTQLSGIAALPFTYVAHVLEVVAAVLVLVWNIYFRGGIAWDSTNKAYIFNLHPVVMVIGYLILGSEGIMSYKGLPFNKEVNKKIHLILHLIALVLGIWGISAAFKFHNESGIDNLYSLHSWVGLGAICLYGIQWLFGFVTYFFPGGSQALRRGALPWHALFGLFVYILALAAAELGFLEKLTFLENAGLLKYSAEAFLVNFTALVVILLGAAVVISAATPSHSEDPHSYSSISDA